MGEIADQMVEDAMSGRGFEEIRGDHKIKRVQATFNCSFKTAEKIRRIQLEKQRHCLEIKELKKKVEAHDELWEETLGKMNECLLHRLPYTNKPLYDDLLHIKQFVENQLNGQAWDV